jgi:uncharacterized membrane protein
MSCFPVLRRALNVFAVGLATGKQLQGFDYDDEAAVAKQYAEMTAILLYARFFWVHLESDRVKG